jgi:hypothetical protein
MSLSPLQRTLLQEVETCREENRSPGRAMGRRSAHTFAGSSRNVRTCLGREATTSFLHDGAPTTRGVKKVPNNVKGNLANVKSVLRKKARERRGRKPAEQQIMPAVQAVVSAFVSPPDPLQPPVEQQHPRERQPVEHDAQHPGPRNRRFRFGDHPVN